MVFLCRRRPDLTHEEYARRVLEDHAPLALRHHTRMRRYVINIAEGTPGGAEELDSLPSLDFDSLEDFRERLYDSPQGEEIIHRDVQRFMGGSDAYATREVVHKDETLPVPLGQRSPGLKWVCPLARHPNLTRERFVDLWLGEHVPLLLKHRPALTKLTSNWVEERLSETGADWDGFAEFHFAGSDAEAQPADSPAGEILAESLARLTVRAPGYPVAEYVQK